MIETLDNGLTVLTQQHQGPGFALELRLPVGAAHDPQGQEGTASLLADWLYKGAGGKDARSLAAAFDQVGLQCETFVSHEATRFCVSGLTADLGLAMSLILDLVERPHLPPKEFEVLIDLARQDLESIADNPAWQLSTELHQAAFAPPYAHTPSGSLESLPSLKAEQVQAFLHYYSPCGAVLAVVCEEHDLLVKDLAHQHFSRWQSSQQIASLPAVRFQGGFVRHHFDESHQTQIGLLFPGVGRTHPDWLLFRLAIEVMSGGTASRLYQTVREERGLAYSVGAQVLTLGQAGFAAAYAGSTPEHAAQTLGVIQEEFRRLSSGVPAAEFQRACTLLLTAAVFARETAQHCAAALAADWHILGRVRELAEIRSVLQSFTVADLCAFLNHHSFDHPAVLTLGPLEPDVSA